MWTEEKLNQMLTTPSEGLIRDVKRIDGDIMILGAGGKMGPTLALLIKNAIKEAGIHKKVIAVSRFTDEFAVKLLKDHHVETISADLMADGSLESLPEADNIIFMAGRKFGTDGQECLTWGMNAVLPSRASSRYRNSNFVVFSSGNIYPMMPCYSGGATEATPPGPVGEYAMSCLARERVFEYSASAYGTKVFLYRLNYAVDLRYGVLYDIASRILQRKPVSLVTPCFNCIWQGDANEFAARGLLRASNPVTRMNITGPELVSVQYVAKKLGDALGIKPIFEGEETGVALLSNSAKCLETFGYPRVSLDTMIEWQAQWLTEGGRTLSKPTHFEERNGKF